MTSKYPEAELQLIEGYLRELANLWKVDGKSFATADHGVGVFSRVPWDVKVCGSILHSLPAYKKKKTLCLQVSYFPDKLPPKPNAPFRLTPT
jgi:hypothetical protein